jgi:hypothetical protein
MGIACLFLRRRREPQNLASSRQSYSSRLCDWLDEEEGSIQNKGKDDKSNEDQDPGQHPSSPAVPGGVAVAVVIAVGCQLRRVINLNEGEPDQRDP